VLIAGIAGLAAGALSMAAGEYVSVSSQRDAEDADILREEHELKADPRGELEELVSIYRKRGLDAELARKVAEQLSANNRLEVHMRDELGLQETTRARPIQAGLVSAASFASLAALPILALVVAPASLRNASVAGVSLVALAALGALGGYLGGAPIVRAALRVVVGGGAAMAVTALIGRLVSMVAVG
jgi:vacuolar iron transporter family protein